MEQIQSKKIADIRNGLFLAAYTIWIVRAFFNTTFFYENPLFVGFRKYALDGVIYICLLCVILDFAFELKEVALMFLICLLFCIARANGAGSLAVALLLIYAARYVPFRMIIKWSVALEAVLLTFVVTSSLLGIIENYKYVQGGTRVRYALGFVYCSYASHYLLLFFMLYFVVRKRIRWFEIALLLVLNGIGYMATDTKTDIISLVLMLAGTVILRLLYHRKKVLRWVSYGTIAVPFLFWGISMWAGKAFNMAVPVWQKANQFLNGRLQLSSDALQTYPIHLFGQKIQWVGGSAKMKDPSLVYNYVDNNYLSVTLQLGVVFAFCMCLVYGRAMYISIQKNQLALATGLFVFVVIGLVNPEMRNLLYNTFLLVLLKPAEQFEEIESWQPREKKENGHAE